MLLTEDRRRVDCVSQMMQLLHHMKQTDLAQWGHDILSEKCDSEDEQCIKTRLALIRAIAQVTSPEAQRLIIDTVMRGNPSEAEMETCIYGLATKEDPVPVRLLDKRVTLNLDNINQLPYFHVYINFFYPLNK